uniref:Cytochrome c oxidase subunit 3 n=1 Tax=Camallanus cotti TaxID=375143 RepID=A0A343LEL9_9BILA|nr:cytochrome c oxidase subunit III [Camallanus cotti]ATO58493.1 cytochrome c oxidase subunit 3 [Camallanus cotti]
MKHSFHVLGLSILPVMVSLGILSLASSFIVFLLFSFNYSVFYSLMVIFFVLIFWGKDVGMESLSGCHNIRISEGFRYGMYLFVFSEVMFFFSIFWFFFDCAVSSDEGAWPPSGVEMVDPMGVPFLNTMILLTKSLTVTWAHHCLLVNKDSVMPLFVTCFLGLFFIKMQVDEYSMASFSISDCSYGSIFYLSTGFHGAHVTGGTLFLLFNLFRLFFNHFNSLNNLGLEFGIVYWHFVDVVWLFLFVFVYCWNCC